MLTVLRFGTIGASRSSSRVSLGLPALQACEGLSNCRALRCCVNYQAGLGQLIYQEILLDSFGSFRHYDDLS